MTLPSSKDKGSPLVICFKTPMVEQKPVVEGNIGVSLCGGGEVYSHVFRNIHPAKFKVLC